MVNYIKLSTEKIDKCNEFGLHMAASNSYADSNQTSKEMIFFQGMIGKAGEFAVSLWLDRLHIKNKMDEEFIQDYASWNPDITLVDLNKKISVKTKSAESEKRYGMNWIFQIGKRHDKLEEDLVALVIEDGTLQNTLKLYALQKMKDVIPFFHTEGLPKHLIGHKCILEWVDILKNFKYPIDYTLIGGNNINEPGKEKDDEIFNLYKSSQEEATKFSTEFGFTKLDGDRFISL